MNEKKLKTFERPRVISQVTLALERNFVASIVDDISDVETTGQEVSGIYDAQGDEFFNHEWGE